MKRVNESTLREEEEEDNEGRESDMAERNLAPPGHRYTPFYCEENVYWLCRNLSENGVADPDASDLYVVFMTGVNKQLFLWQQKHGRRVDGHVIWDYHVVCAQRKGSLVPLVWDLDTRLGFPYPLPSYYGQTTRPNFCLPPYLERLFRVVHAPMFLRHFASDRRHMKKEDGTWLKAPPPHDPIVCEDGTIHNLNEYTEMRIEDIATEPIADLLSVLPSKRYGVVLEQSQIELFFTQAA